VVAWCGGACFVLSLLYFLYCYLIVFGRVTSRPSSGRPLAVNALLFTAFALHHSLFARTALKTFVTRLVHPAVERSVYTWTASVLFLLVCWLWQAVPGELYQLAGPGAIPGYAVQAAGLLLTLRGSAKLDVLDLAGVRPLLDARRGRLPEHVPLETRGVYRLVRHPLYLGWALVVFGAPHMTLTRLSFAVISTAYLALAIPLEERSLSRVFGAEYEAYKRQVRWRMLPGVY
jgi:protein-S-isoprenylcysteine O-methyltransferase Ste14